jgi:hypothetical protein
MALTDEQLETLADKYLISLYQQMERDVIQDIARRVRKTDRLTETAEIMARNMHEQGFSTAKIYAEVMKVLRADPEYMALVAENTKEYKAMVTEIIKETVEEARAAGNKLVAEAGTMECGTHLSGERYLGWIHQIAVYPDSFAGVRTAGDSGFLSECGKQYGETHQQSDTEAELYHQRALQRAYSHYQQKRRDRQTAESFCRDADGTVGPYQ